MNQQNRNLAGRALRFLALALALALPMCAREYPPDVPSPKPMVIPAPVVQKLANGLQVVVVERHNLPLITLRLVVKSGAECDPPSLPGVAALTNGLLTEGTKDTNARQLAEIIDSAGGVVDNDVDWDSSYLSLSMLTDSTDLAFSVMSEMTLHPGFEPAEIERQRKQTISSLEVSQDDASYVADMAMQRLIYSGTPYGHPENGTVESAKRISARDIRDFHHRYYQPNNSILAIVGDISAAEALGLSEKYFGHWKNNSEPAPVLSGEPSAPEKRVVVAIDKPEAVQTEIRVGSVGVARDDPNYLALSVANEILGGPSENRLFKALRTQKGLTYGASSDLITRRHLGSWVAKTFTRTPETLKSAHVAMEQVESMQDHGINRPELETAQSYMVGHLALEFETSDNLAGKVLDLMLDGLPLDYWSRYPANIKALTTDQVDTAARQYFTPDHEFVVLVGSVSDFKKDLKKLGDLRAIPLTDVDLGSPDLVKAAGSKGTAPEGN